MDGALFHSENQMPVFINHQSPGNNGEIRVTGASVRGSRHERSGQPCQDAYAVARGTEKTWGVAVADGLGSASHADVGASIAVDAACKAILPAGQINSDAEAEHLIRNAFLQAREAVLAEAVLQDITPAAFGSTLIAALFFENTLIIGHLGDGIVVGIKDGVAEILSPPGVCEYANETASLMQADWEDQLRISCHNQVTQCILTTDGCQAALATRRGGGYHPHEPFILPLLSFIRQKNESNSDTDTDITALLISSKMQELSGDDKTLVVMTGPDLPS